MSQRKSEVDFAKQQARTERSTLIRLKHRLAANTELYYTEEEFEGHLDKVIGTGGVNLLDVQKVLEILDGIS